MINILFVCTGDTCRSTMASAIAKQRARERGLTKFGFSSAGLFVGKETNINENARKTLKRMNVKIPRHKATQLTYDIIKKYRYCLTMTVEQKQTILNRFNDLTNVFTFGEIVGGKDILDPYGKGEAEYYSTALVLDEYIDKLLNKLGGENIWK